MLVSGVGIGPPVAKTLRCISRIASMPLNSRPLGRVKQASCAYKAIRASRSRARMLAKYRSVTSAEFILILQMVLSINCGPSAILGAPAHGHCTTDQSREDHES